MPPVREQRRPAGRGNSGGKPVIQSAARMLRLIRLLIRSPGGNRLSELSAELALPKATVLRLVQTLVGEGIAVKDPASGVYRLNSLFWLAMATSFPDARLVQQEVQETLDWLARASSATALLVIPEVGRRRMSLNSSALPDHPLVARPPQDAVTHMHALAAGKCYLASLSDAALRRWLEGDLPQVTEHTITSREALWDEIVQVRAQGYALHREELASGCWGIAVSVTDGTGEMAAALQLSAPLTLMTRENMVRWLPLLQRAATRLSGLLTPGATRPVRPHRDSARPRP
jgi:IclR family transcriptional regulator, KDG regulon repressor